MIAVRDYLLRLTACAFLVALCSAFVTQQRIRRIVRLCGGCLLAILALSPLLQLNWASLPDALGSLGGASQTQLETAKEKNDKLLEQLILDRTTTELTAAAAGYGLELSIVPTLRWDAELGLPVPWSVRLRGNVGTAEQQRFSDYLAEEFGIPPERQVWQTE